MMNVFVAVLTVAAIGPLVVDDVVATEPSAWYTRYPSYPEYCSTPDQMNERKIPVLPDSKAFGETHLAQVTTIIRHGARTPWGSDISCWEGFWSSPETGRWDCNLTTLLAPPSPPKVRQEETDHARLLLRERDLFSLHKEREHKAAHDAMFLFEKKYDALILPLKNELNGTCEKAQLLLQGYEQQMTNGEFLREAYVMNKDGSEVNKRMRLFELSLGNAKPFQEPHLRFRVDDDQRTLLSGQVLLRGLFGQEFVQHVEQSNGGNLPIIPLHTADREQDILGANARQCPRLVQLQTKIEESKIYKEKFVTGKEAKEILSFYRDELGIVTGTLDLDCLMTTICTDRPLPRVINDFGGNNGSYVAPPSDPTPWNIDSFIDDADPRTDEEDISEPIDDDNDVAGDDSTADGGNRERRILGSDDIGMFERIRNFAVEKTTFRFKYNDGEYSKLAMASLWSEIMQKSVLPLVHPKGYPDYTAPKLSLISGHDTTIMPFLSSLGPELWKNEAWPPYASMVMLEIHAFVGSERDLSLYPSDFAFRLIFNGNVLTPKIKGCPNDQQLCDIQVLISYVSPFAFSNNCATPSDTKNYGTLEEMESWLKHAPSYIGTALVSMLIGSISTFFFLAGRFPFFSSKKRDSSLSPLTGKTANAELTATDSESEEVSERSYQVEESSFSVI